MVISSEKYALLTSSSSYGSGAHDKSNRYSPVPEGEAQQIVNVQARRVQEMNSLLPNSYDLSREMNDRVPLQERKPWFSLGFIVSLYGGTLHFQLRQYNEATV